MSYWPGSYGPIDWENASPEEAALTGLVVGRVRHWEDGLGRQFRDRCKRFFCQYREFEDWRQEHGGAATPADRDVAHRDAKTKWGANLHIPQSFRAIEQIVPPAIANMPKLLYAPRDEQWTSNVETVRLLIDAQQAQINIDLPLQAVLRSGLMYGLGVGKAYWRREVRMRRRLEQHALRPSKWVPGDREPVVTFDDPMFEDVDVFDFMWDPYGFDLASCDWVVHRTWLSFRTVMDRVESKAWGTGSAQKLDAETICALHPEVQRYSEIWQERMRVSGLDLKESSAPGEHPHEVLEFHDGERVLTVLDRQVLVQDNENAIGEMPFQIYRPTPLGKQFVGIGMLEPIEVLNRELNTLRSQRTDARTIALAGGFAFDENAIDRDDLQFGPDAAIPVSNAAPKDALFPIPRQDVPASGYEDEAPILRDIEGVTGMSDARVNQPGGAASGSATEATLAQASLSARVSLLSRRFEQEVVRMVARQFLLLDQRMITENRPALLEPGQGGNEQLPAAGEWRYFPVGPGELEGEYEIEPEGGSMEARNVAQDRNDGVLLLQNLAHDFYMNPTVVRLHAMKLFGIKHPKGWLRSQEPSVPQAVLRILLEGGLDPNQLMEAVIRAREIEAPQEGPAASQITEQVGTEGTP